MQLCKERLVILIQEFMGTGILEDIQQSPNWRINLDTARAKSACRYDRRK
jgi:hypothetical protein